MNAILCLVVCFSALVAAAPTDYDMGYDHDMTYAQPMTYAAPSYAAPSYDVHDVTKIVDYDYAVNDYYGNEQTRQEYVAPGKQDGYWNARMADGAIHSVTYDANDYGNLAHVVVRQNSYAAPAYSAPVQTYAAPVYSAPAYAAPMHYEENNVYAPQTYSAPTYSHY